MTKAANPSASVGEGWQLRFILAMLYSACAKQERGRTGKAPFQSHINELLIWSGAVPVAVDHYELGKGFVPKAASNAN